MKREYRPMLATLVDKPFDDEDWVFETKWDGFRMIADIRGGKVTLWSRNGVDVTKKYAAIVPALKKIRRSCVIDGELCALDGKGRSRFQLLQNALNKKTTLLYVVFDLLFVDGADMRRATLLERKATLRALLPADPRLCYSRHVVREGKKEFAKAKRRGEEGVIAKRAAGRYYSGKRTREWLKFKAVQEQEVVILGFTKPRGARRYLGALLVGVRERGAWKYAGKVGTGFTEQTLRDLYRNLLPLKSHSEGDTTWVKPALVAEVKFTEWTTGGELRHPVFLGLRTDKKATDVIRERI